MVSGAGAFGYQYHPGFGGSYDSSLWQKLTFPGGAYVSRSFDTAGRVQSTSLLNSSATVLSSHTYGYDGAGRRTNYVRFDNTSVAYSYDDAGQLKTASGKEPGGATRLNEQFGYAYDAAGNLNYRTNNDLVVTFNPNALNQLSTVTRTATMTVSGNASSAAASITVNGSAATLYTDKTYAKNGIALANGNNTFTAIATDSSGRKDTNAITLNLPSSISFIYDLNGSLTSDGRRGFDYDDENQLIRVTLANSWKTEFTYDGLNRRRVRKEFTWSGSWVLSKEVHYIYDGNLVIQERDGSNNPLVTYTRGLDLSGSFQDAGGIGGLLARTDANSAFYHADGNGNVTTMVNANQAIVATYSYDPFGNTLASSGTLAEVNTYRFSSQEYHQNSGLLLYLRRAYDPNLQRFLGRDPVAELGGLNLYGFARNGPLNRFDSWGLDDAMDELNRLIPGDHVPRARDVHALDPDTQDNLMDTVGPLIDPSWKNFCRVGAKFYNFFDPARQLREGLHLMPLLSLLAGQPELAALFSLTDAILYASEGDIKGTILAGIGALPLVGAVGKAVGAVTGTTARALTVADLGIQGTVKQLNASLSIRNGVAYVRVAALSGEIKNPLQVMNNLIGLAKSQGATALRIEAMVSNPRLRSILEARYGLFHSGGKDVITVLIP